MLFLASFVSAGYSSNAHTATVSWVVPIPTQIYEHSKSAFMLKVDNGLGAGNKSIDFVSLNTYNFEVQPITPNNWNLISSQFTSNWSTNLVALANGASQIFQFNLTAPNVIGNTVYNVTILTNDTVSSQNINNLSITVLNDVIPPRYTIINPLNATIVKNETILFNITYTESESGFNNGSLIYNYTSLLFESELKNYLLMDCVINSCNTFLNITKLESFFSLKFNLTDKAGNHNETPYIWLYVDVDSPTINNIFPDDGFNTSLELFNVTVNVSDDSFSLDSGFSPLVNCSVNIDNIYFSSVTFNSNNTKSIESNISSLIDGNHSWYVECVDKTGWNTVSSNRTFKFDTTGPVISLINPLNNSVIEEGSIVNLNVVDGLSDVDVVWYTNSSNNVTINPYNVNTSGWSYGINYLNVFANDSLGNLGQNLFTFKVDNLGPSIILLHPNNNSLSNSVRFNATDEFSFNLSCNLLINGSINQTVIAQNSTEK